MNHQDLLNALLGEWSGSGKGEYPTIAPFEYVETLRFTSNTDLLIHYEQKTERLLKDQAEPVPSHWESGFIRLLDDGTVQVNNAQSGGRTELLTGPLDRTEKGFILRLRGTSFLNDPRMLESSRTIEMIGEALQYNAHMRTNAVPKMTIHLEARLHRNSQG